MDEGQDHAKKEGAHKREANRCRFQFVYMGNFDPDYWCREIGLQSAISVEGTHGYKYAAIKTSERRATELESRFDKHDSQYPQGNQIKLTNLAGYERIVSFEKGQKPENHVIYETIQKFKNSPTYSEWSTGEKNARKKRRFLRELEIDMQKEAITPSGMRNKAAANEGPVSNISIGSDVAEEPKCNAPVITEPTALDELFETYNFCDKEQVHTPIEDTNSRDSSSSSAELSPKQKPLVKVITRMIGRQTSELVKVKENLEGVKDRLDKVESKDTAFQHLVARTEAIESELKLCQHKLDVQEGKTAAQTRTANQAKKNETEALKAKEIAEQEAQKEKQRRQKAEGDVGILMSTNLNISETTQTLAKQMPQSVQVYCFRYLDTANDLTSLV